LKIAARCVVIGSDGSPTTSQEIWQRPSPNSCSKMRPISPSRRCRNTYAHGAASRTTRLVAIESWSCFSFWKVNQGIINYVRPLPSNNPGRRTCSTLSHIDPKADGFADDGNLKALLLPYPADQMRMWEISPRVNSPKNDDHRFGNPFMRSQHRRQPLRLNSCASRQTRLRDFHGPKRDSHQLSTRFPANSVWSDPDNLSKRLFGTI
jgi:hypothetical protein